MTLITFVYNINLHHMNFIHPAQYGLISHRQVILELTVYSVTQERNKGQTVNLNILIINEISSFAVTKINKFCRQFYHQSTHEIS